MLNSLKGFFKKFNKKEEEDSTSKDAAKERLHLVLMQDRANVSADFLEMMKQEIVDVIKKYIDVDEAEMDVRLTNQVNEDGTNGAPALYANIPIIGIKNEKINGIDKPANKNNENNDINKNVSENSGKNINIKENKESKAQAKVTNNKKAVNSKNEKTVNEQTGDNVSKNKEEKEVKKENKVVKKAEPTATKKTSTTKTVKKADANCKNAKAKNTTASKTTKSTASKK